MNCVTKLLYDRGSWISIGPFEIRETNNIKFMCLIKVLKLQYV